MNKIRMNKYARQFCQDSNFIVLRDNSERSLDYCIRKLNQQMKKLHLKNKQRGTYISKGQKKRFAINECLKRRRKLEKLKKKYGYKD